MRSLATFNSCSFIDLKQYSFPYELHSSEINIFLSSQVLPRNFVQSELDDLVLNYNSKLDFYINIGDIDSVSELVSGVLSNLNYEATRDNSSVYELQKKVRSVFIPNRIFLVRFGGKSGEFDQALVRILAKIPMARPNEPDLQPKCAESGTIRHLPYPNLAKRP